VKTAVVTIRKEPYYRRAAIESGLKRLGYNVVSSGLRPSGPESLLLLWNKKKGKEEQDADAWERQGGTVIVMENAYLQKVDKTYYAISVHGHNGSGWFPVGDEDRFSKLGFPVKPWQPDNFKGHDLVLGQRGIGSTLMASPSLWGEKLTAKLKARGFNARLRVHPGNYAPKVPLLADLKGAKACHIWSSSGGVMALVEGIPVYHHAPHWICSGAGPLTQWQVLNRMSHGQWHHEEIATGEPFARILAKLGEAKW
jgi:hypothetical protein